MSIIYLDVSDRMSVAKVSQKRILGFGRDLASIEPFIVGIERRKRKDDRFQTRRARDAMARAGFDPDDGSRFEVVPVAVQLDLARSFKNVVDLCRFPVVVAGRVADLRDVQ
jgi:hypothetical protein